MSKTNFPEYLKSDVMYQLFLRSCTAEGTLNAAAQLLPHIKSIGADIVYLCPPFAHDLDDNPDHWSPRQHASKTGNPSNPYRMKDYYNIDPEYGTNADLRAFIDAAHALGLKVILDLVYLHCGPKAVFLDEHPDYVKRDADGNLLTNHYHFLLLNFDNPALCEYMWQNMEFCIREFDCDGFRCDVGDQVPLFFWEEGRRRMDAIKPGCMMLNEGSKAAMLDKAFDISYDFGLYRKLFDILDGKAPASALAEYRKNFEANNLGGDGMSILCFDNHDISNDAYENRAEKRFGEAACDAMLFLIFTMRGVPFLYNGQEVCDANRHSIWANRFHGANMVVDWQNALTEKGQRRMEYLRKLAKLHRASPAICGGSMQWLETTAPESVVAYLRESEGQRLLFAVNLTGAPVTAEIAGGGEAKPVSLGGYGTMMAEM